MDNLKKLPLFLYETLITANIDSLSMILTLTKNDLLQKIDQNDEFYDLLLKESVNLVLRNKFIAGSLIRSWDRLSTGSIIDSVTKGGLPLTKISEIYGSSGVGKTQICLQLALTVQLSYKLGGLNKACVYICTEDVFPSRRFHELAENFQTKHNLKFEDNVFIQHVSDFEKLKCCLFKNLPNLLKVKAIGLLVIDSIAGIFRSENQNIDYFSRSQDFLTFTTKLTKLARKHNFAVLCVNQVTDNIETGKTEPCLGLAWSNLVTCRFAISRLNFTQEREFQVIFAPDLPNKSCKFVINSEGICSVT